jgi:hypothetical protein
MSLQQLMERRFNHGASQVLNRSSQHDPQLPVAMLVADRFTRGIGLTP